MHVAVIIPYRPQHRHHTLAWTLEGYARQQLAAGHTMDVRVGLDGEPEAPAAEALPEIPGADHPIAFHLYPHIGASAVRNALARDAHRHADLLVFGNADARPVPDMVQTHLTTMMPLPPRSLVLGSAPWERQHPTVIDAMIDATPMIFSYCHAEPLNFYPFRIAYSLNLSVRSDDFAACGGFPELIRPYYYEDLAFGCRVLGPEHKGLLYQPQAQVLHRHPMTLQQYLDREELLGIMAPVLARHCPEAFAVLMARRQVDDIARDFERKLSSDTSVYRTIYKRLQETCPQPAETLGSGDRRTLAIESLYQLHIPVKLLAFRLGFLRGIELADDARWLDRVPAGLWRTHLEK